MSRWLSPHSVRTRRGIATLWTIVALPVMVLCICLVVESSRLYLAKAELTTALESAALAAAKDWCQRPGTFTLVSRQVAVDFAEANLVLGSPLVLDRNLDASVRPNENASCDGELLFGTLEETSPQVIFNSGMVAGCGRPEGPNAYALLQRSRAGWQPVTLCGRVYNSMVVIGTPVYDETARPMVVRLRNVGSGSFEFLVQDTNSGGSVPDVWVYFFVAEAGVYRSADWGVTMEVVRFDSTATDSDGSWVAEPRPYLQAYSNPVVLGQVMSFNDPDWSVFWCHGGNRSIPPGASLFVGKHVGQDADTTRNVETIGYVVIEQGPGDMHGLPYFAAVGDDLVRGVRNSPPYRYGFANDIGSFVVATKAAEAGGNGAWALLYGADPLAAGRIDLALDEYQLTDRRHTTEPVSYVVFGGPCAVHARASREYRSLCRNLFGCVLGSHQVSAQVTAMFDCERRCARLICPDRVVCP